MEAKQSGSGGNPGGGGTATATADRGPVHPAGHSGSGGDGTTPHTAHPTDALRGIGPVIAELREYFSYYLAVKIDGFKVTARNIGIFAALGVLALIAGSAVVTTAVVLLLVGLAMAIGDLLGDKLWAGALIVGALVLGGLAFGVVLFMKKLTKTSRAALVKKYENRQREQRARYGHDVRGREADATDGLA